MPGRSLRGERAALDEFRGVLQGALLGVTPAILSVRPGALVLSQRPAPLGRDRAFALSLDLAVAELGVEPLRDDWRERLAEAEGVLRASLG